MDGWKNKVYSVVKGPGWMPGTPWTGNLDDVPDVILKLTCAGFEFIKLSFWQVRGRKPFEGKRLSVYMKVYIVVHFMTVLFAYEAVSLFKNVSLKKFPKKKFKKK